jgi:hypothetical protein
MLFDRPYFAERGLHLPPSVLHIIDDPIRARFAMDAQQGLITTSNAGIPSYLTNYIDPETIEVLFAPNEAANVMAESGGEVQKGDWTTLTATFPIVERTGEVSTYGDWNTNGSAGMNANFPQFESYHYQTISQWGEREVDLVALAKINYANEVNEAAVFALNRFQNTSYFNGLVGLQNYGILNFPGLPAALLPGPKAFGAAAHGPWITAGVVTATANEVFTDIQSLVTALVAQSGGLIKINDPMTLAMTPGSELGLTATNSFNVNVSDLLKKNFPKLRVVTAVNYGTAAGNLVQLIADKVQSQRTGMVAYTEKMRAHPVIPDLSSWKQKKSQGTWGAIFRQTFAVAQMLGV